MGKIKIIVGIVILTAFVVGGYFYYQNQRDKKKESLFGSISTTLKQPVEESSQDSLLEEVGESFVPGETEELGQSVQSAPKIIASENPIETISRPESPAESRIQEQISKPEMPSQIAEKKFKLIVPPPLPPEPPIILSATKSSEDEEEPEDEEEEEESASTSSPAILPQVSVYLSDYNISFRQFTVNWQSSSTDISTFDVERKIGIGDWQNWLASTTATSTVFQVPQDRTVYYFRARVANGAGLSSDWQEISAPIYFYPVAINEIAWAGTSASSSADEWIELYNKSDFPVNLNSWFIVEGKDSTTTEVALQGQINAHGYYLIERTDDTTVSDITADLAKSFGGSGLSNSGENLRLVDTSGQIIDVVDCSGGWLAGSAAPYYRSMERVNPYLAFDIPGNWQSNSTSTRNGSNVDGQPINGTPRAQNSVFNLEFFYLYPAQNTTATSTDLKWTPSFIDNFNEFKVIRSFEIGFNAMSTAVVITTITTDFFDESLESETAYFYKISACDFSDFCVSSNVASTTTSEFPFSWAEPQKIFEISTSTPDDQIFDFVLDENYRPIIIWSNSSSTPETATSTAVELLNNKNKPYIFWADNNSGSEGIYFTYLKDNGLWQQRKTALERQETILRLRTFIDLQNIAYIVWQNNQREIWYTSGKIE